MTDDESRDALAREVATLPPDLRARALQALRTLALRRAPGTPGRDLVNLSGGFSPSDVDVMTRAIRDHCEQ